eukprot:CAMPEP_0174356784 /NCGR_PEP_ID=MMETSP0811_2-20130205/31885_1 /TAXON_ID=73025 ORGANISM="Eutreptiella gymnastica-like, Strain CCMP1594" /NCGR_SAMPLE_ID=MMETSP0811_2 /ASSEMBLY_ACC=CAM_ASM_000667 /LENGTH=44 /DNA_ID= /DNA_START= /DNA_END= /DNA_ORIENTATION=
MTPPWHEDRDSRFWLAGGMGDDVGCGRQGESLAITNAGAARAGA